MTQGACSSDDGKSDTAERPDSVLDDAGPDGGSDGGGSDGGSDAGTPQNGDYDGGGIPIYAAAPTSDDGTRLVSRPSRGRSTNS
ncbi:hypothetical protein AKJ09_08725 [Labilithrix luteola]|uniref:Uncharacterized protein n=1 Tax=Labilithrix luteola TaxID=1391654 RepID=A0A0K1Q8Q9_9BACT|nr:hypothetical protein [Labilithrix luteola]AKV02062.1 hypothetical protein AKJ09_08725 [Labilithrix luteola]